MENGFIYQTPLGKIVITENGYAITVVMFGESLPEQVNARETPLLKQANDQLQEYFIGQRKSFDLPLAPQGTARALRWLSDLGLRRAAPAPLSEGNLFRPSLHTAIDGGHRRRLQGSAGLVALLGVAGLALGWWLGRRR